MNKTIIFYGLGLVVLLIGGVFLIQNQEKTVISQAGDKSPRELCVEHSSSLSMHIHSELEIFVDGQKELIPANIGITSDCMMALHTHDESGKIHIEYPRSQDFTLGDFMANWGKTLSREGYNMVMKVDELENNDGENVILKDPQKIVINYSKASE